MTRGFFISMEIRDCEDDIFSVGREIWIAFFFFFVDNNNEKYFGYAMGDLVSVDSYIIDTYFLKRRFLSLLIFIQIVCVCVWLRRETPFGCWFKIQTRFFGEGSLERFSDTTLKILWLNFKVLGGRNFQWLLSMVYLWSHLCQFLHILY